MAWLGVIVAVLMLALSVALWGDETPSWVLVLNGVLAIGILAALVIFSSLRVDVTTDEFVVRWGPLRWPRRAIAWQEVAAVSSVSVDPWDWGGWGYRWAPGGRGTAAVVKGGPGIRLDLINGKRFTVTVDDADHGAHACSLALAAHRRAPE